MKELDPRLIIDPTTVGIYTDHDASYMAGRRKQGEGVYIQLGRNPGDEPNPVSLPDDGSEPVYVTGPYFVALGSPSRGVTAIEGSQAGWGRHFGQDSIRLVK